MGVRERLIVKDRKVAGERRARCEGDRGGDSEAEDDCFVIDSGMRTFSLTSTSRDDLMKVKV